MRRFFAKSRDGEGHSHPVPFRTILVSVVGLWLCYFALMTVRGALVGIGMEGDVLIRRCAVTLASIVLTLILWWLLRLFDRSAMWIKIVAAAIIALPIAIAGAHINQYAFADLENRYIEARGNQQGIKLRRDETGNILVEVPPPPAPPEFGRTGESHETIKSEEHREIRIARAPTLTDRLLALTDLVLSRYFLLLAWAALYLALLAGAQARAAERRAGEFRQAAKAAELRSLRYQVNPHFLFNTLNSLSALVMTGKAGRAEEMIQNISNFYRHSLAGDPTSDVALEDEFEMQRIYLDIEAVRFPERLVTRFKLPDTLAKAKVPGMILQPLVENSIKYAVAAAKRPVTITLSARKADGNLVLSVSDDGPASAEKSEHGFGIGLANVRDRIKARFGRHAKISSGPVKGGYVTVLTLPLE